MKRPNIFLYSLALAFCIFVQISHANQFPQSVLKQMATRNMRHHHFMWHQIRGNWNKFSNETKESFRKIGWAPPNPARDSNGKPIIKNFAGEDFLFMHRHMINQAKDIALKNNESIAAFTSWKSIPAPGDKRYPVPPAFKKGNITKYYYRFKTDAHYDYMRKLEIELKDPAKLKKLTLNQLGLKIENRIHNSLHFRWANASALGYRTGEVTNASMPHINKKWDDIRYNWMGDSYGSHVNPLIWKVHGWIDDRVEDWRKAKGIETIRWRGNWTGGPMSTLGGAFMKAGDHMNMMMTANTTNSTETNSDDVGDVLAKAVEILQKSGVPELTMEADHDLATQHRRSRKEQPKKETKKSNITTTTTKGK